MPRERHGRNPRGPRRGGRQNRLRHVSLRPSLLARSVRRLGVGRRSGPVVPRRPVGDRPGWPGWPVIPRRNGQPAWRCIRASARARRPVAGCRAAAPHETVLRRDRVCPVAADQRGEDGVGVAAGCAHPDDVPARPDQGPSLPIRDQRVFPQYVRRECIRRQWHGHRPRSPPQASPATRARRTQTRVLRPGTSAGKGECLQVGVPDGVVEC